MRQALKLLQVAATDLHAEIQEELQKNPTLEELPPDAADRISLDTQQPDTGPAHATTETDEDAGGASPHSFPSPAELDFAQNTEPALPDAHDSFAKNASDTSSDYSSEATGATDYAAAGDPSAEARRQHFFDSLVAPPSLYEHLSAQAALTDLSAAQRHALDYLIGALDERGYLTQSLEDAAQQSGHPLADLVAAAAALRSFDPPGIGAHSLPECLLLQLRASEPDTPRTSAHAASMSPSERAPASDADAPQAQHAESRAIAARILAEHFDLLTRRGSGELARALGASPAAVQRALALIGRLDPAPGRRFAADTNRIVEPDIEVARDAGTGTWQLTLNRRYIPRLRLSNTYRDLIAKGTLAPHERDYLRERMRAGRLLIDAIEQRQHTLEKLARELLALQHDFFEHGPAHLRPLTMTELAARLGLHETTISRAVANKFIKTPHGLFPLRAFFTSGYQAETGERLANTSVKELIADLIAAEDRDAPLSDQAIADHLRTRGLTLARRTVTKYREALNLPPSPLRK